MPDSFVYTCLDVLSVLGPVRSRRMFGGYGIYHGETMFGLIADDVLYLKVDDSCRAAFEDAGSTAFSYSRKDGRSVAMSYFEMPAEGLETLDAARRWGTLALEAARRARG